MALRLWLREVLDGLNFLGERDDTLFVNMMTEEVQLWNTENALIRVDDDPMRRETFKDCAQMIEVLLRSGTSDKDVIDVRIC